MRINRLWIDEFKNLSNFEITFNDALTTIVIGGNGTGKSNLLEAIAIIFRDLDLQNRQIPFEYFLVYECRGHNIEIDANPKQNRSVYQNQLALIDGFASKKKRRPGYLNISVDKQEVTISHFFEHKEEFLPNHVFGYYSGPTNRLAKHFDQHQKKFYDEQRKGEKRPLRPLFFALPIHSLFVLLAYFSFPDEVGTRFLQDYFGIVDLESVLFELKEPDWKTADYPAHPFWGASGIPYQFLNDLYTAALAPLREEVTVPVRTGKNVTEEHLYLYIKDANTVIRVAQARGSNQEFFKDMDTLYIARLIDDLRVRVRRVGLDGNITFTELSEGEQQLLTVLGLLKFTKDSETLFLLDEPDTHLNPAWKYEYLRLIEPIVGDDTQCQILLITHDPIVMASCVKEQVRVMYCQDKADGIVAWFQPEQDPRGMGIGGLLTSKMWGLESQLDWITQQKIDEKRRLVIKDKQGKLTDEEREQLQKLSEELENLGFNYTFRDPLYTAFLEEMAKQDQSLVTEQADLTEEQKEKQAKVVEELVAKLKSQP